MLTDIEDGRATWEQPDRVAHSHTESLVLKVVRAQGGDEAIAKKPAWVGSYSTRPVPADPLLGIVAARAVRNRANQLIGDYAKDARGAGKSWRELAEPLGVDDAEAAYEFVAGDWGGRQSWVGWACGSCEKRVIDRGPYAGHPDECEEGHEPRCVRHAAEVAKWQEEH